jgi:hypothetical protein
MTSQATTEAKPLHQQTSRSWSEVYQRFMGKHMVLLILHSICTTHPSHRGRATLSASSLGPRLCDAGKIGRGQRNKSQRTLGMPK